MGMGGSYETISDCGLRIVDSGQCVGCGDLAATVDRLADDPGRAVG